MPTKYYNLTPSKIHTTLWLGLVGAIWDYQLEEDRWEIWSTDDNAAEQVACAKIIIMIRALEYADELTELQSHCIHADVFRSIWDDLFTEPSALVERLVWDNT
jgi:hypothetical protein